MKAHPDVPTFDYNITNNAVGLAYIEVMAAFENREDKSQDFAQFINQSLISAEE
jgi:cytochrome c551/c552